MTTPSAVATRQVCLQLTETALFAADYGAECEGVTRDEWVSRAVWEAALELDRRRAAAREPDPREEAEAAADEDDRWQALLAAEAELHH